MKNPLPRFLPLALVIAALLNREAAAAPIVGEISFSGSYTVDNSDLMFATKFVSFSNVTVSALPTGDYLGLDAAGVTHSGFSFSPFPVGGSVPLWTIPSSPGTSFDLLSLTVEYQSSSILLVKGTGIAHKAGRDNTPGNWILSANTLGTTFSFSSTNASEPNPVPEPGTALFGLAILGVTTIRRRR